MEVDRRSSVIIIWCIFCKLLFITQISAYSTGARTDSCLNLDVTHLDGNNLPILASTDPSPFRITILNSDGQYRINREVTVVIETDPGRSVTGFMIQARRQGSALPIGTWTTIPATAQLLTCQTSGDTLTHNNIQQPIVSRLEMKWSPAQNYGQVEFWATFTESFSVFWTNQRSQPITYDERAVVYFTKSEDSVNEGDGIIPVEICVNRAVDPVEVSLEFTMETATESDGIIFPRMFSVPITPVFLCSTFSVTLTDDVIPETDETFLITIASTSGTTVTDSLNGAIRITIRDNDGGGGGGGGGGGLENINIGVTPNFLTASEEDGSATFSVCISQVIDSDIVIEFDVVPIIVVANDPVSNDLTFSSPLTIPLGSTCSPLTIVIVNDDVVEANKGYVIDVTSSQPAVNIPQRSSIFNLLGAEATDRTLEISLVMDQLTISEDESSIQISVCASNITEQDISVGFSIERLPASSVPVSDDLSFESPLTLAAGSLCNSISISVVQDELVEADENYVIMLTSAQPMGTLVDGSLTLTLIDSQLEVCSSQPCSNGGTCMEIDDGQFRCLCEYGYLGNTCDQLETFLPVSISPSMVTITEGAGNVTLEVCHSGVQNFSNVLLSVDLGTASPNDVITDLPLGEFTVSTNQSYPCVFFQIEALEDGINEGDEMLSVTILDVSLENNTLRLDEREITTLITIQDGDPLCVRLTPCENGGQCQDLNDGSFTCTCPSEWFGPTCEIANPCLESSPCQNNGVCSATEDGTDIVQRCTCTDAWVGQYCDTAALCSPNPCQNGGSCSPIQDGSDYECINCPLTHIGKNCDIFLPCSSSPCQNGGVCTNVGQIDVECRCSPQFVGRFCSFANLCLENPELCINGACTPNVDGTQLCQCDAGFSGRFCDIPEVCAGNPCRNGGTCLAQSPSEIIPFTCRCATGFLGDTCELNDLCTVNPCSNGGTCSNSGNGYTCACPIGFAGVRCETTRVIVNRCDLVEPCLNGGTCRRTDETCQCPPGWDGPQCEIRRSVQTPCPPDGANMCQNGAGCVLENTAMKCMCTTGFTGVLCEIRETVPELPDPCAISPCGPDGTCFATSRDTFVCTCKLNFLTGETCDLCKINHCQNGGTCRNRGGSPGCVCPEGVSGVDCEIVEACRNFVCNNGGVCILLGDQTVCECQDGFTGTNCNGVDPCFGVNCQNGGACQSSNPGTCVCPANFVGDNCEVEVQQQSSSARVTQTRISFLLFCLIVSVFLTYCE
ncbi:uncharacterized protein [Apostichopus japonicus]|uniref:uncharacterized protein isoform X2 n=1 Tax=Stichopus japonicus TaxID=307972 RepID=UPI003AB71B27